MRPTRTEEPRVNRRIRVPRVLVIDEEGRKLGEFMTEDAVRLAQERGLDLVEVAPNGRPPVCRITDYGRLKYDRKKKDAQARKNQVQVQIKEVKLRPKTDEHDIAVKIKHIRMFLEEGNKVKITVRFKGREIAHREIGGERCEEVVRLVRDISAVETPPRMDGRQMFMILVPTKKPIRRPEAPVRPNRPGDLDENGMPVPPNMDELEDAIDDDDDDDDDDLDDDDDSDEVDDSDVPDGEPRP